MRIINNGWILFRIIIILLVAVFSTQTTYAETDITNNVQLNKSILGYDRVKSTSYQDINIKNISQNIFLSPVILVIESVSNPDITVYNADGQRIDNGKLYFIYKINSNTFIPGSTTGSKRIEFYNPNKLRFTYTLSVKALKPDASAMIGSAGGVIQVTDSQNRLKGLEVTIPAGALSGMNPIVINEDHTSPPLPDGLVDGGRIINFSPDGTIFSQNITITLPYDDRDNDNIVDYTGVSEDDIQVISFNKITHVWEYVNIVSQDKVNNTVIFQTNHFSDMVVSVEAAESNADVFIYTIDGLSFSNTLWPGNWFDLEPRTNYLQPAILNGSDPNEMEPGMGLGMEPYNLKKVVDVYAWRGTIDLPWNGNALLTSDLVEILIDDLSDKYEANKNKKFIIVTHSWGNVLAKLALQYCPEVKPDLMISLSNPYGSDTDSISDYDSDIFLLYPSVCFINLPGVGIVPSPCIKAYYTWEAQNAVSNFVAGRENETENYIENTHTLINYYRWINYWDDGDVISGPLISVYDDFTSCPPVEDRDCGWYSQRNLFTTVKAHALTSLNKKQYWDDWASAEYDKGIALRNKVKQDILSVWSPTEYFYDDFNGTSLESAKWNTTIATQGLRWCSTMSPSPSLSYPGDWVNVSQSACHGLTTSAPYGSITISNSIATFSNSPSRVFPYIYCGEPSRTNPFPPTGDFVLEVRMRFNSLGGFGSHLHFIRWDNTNPIGNNPPLPPALGVFFIHADRNGLNVGLLYGPYDLGSGSDRIYLSGSTAFHVYRLEYISGVYRLYVDGNLIAGPKTSSLRPNVIWLGNPLFCHGGVSDWSNFSIDYIKVSIP